jgi:acetolactate decarboxylase
MTDARFRAAVRQIMPVLALFFVAGQAIAQHPSSFFSYSTIDALLAGSYDGDLTVGELAKHGNFGLGTFNRLDGEMLAIDGVFYHAKADGTVSVAGPQEKTPLAYVAWFRPTQSFRSTASMPVHEFESALDGRLKNPNLFYAIRVDGEFREVSVRAIAPQSKPYKPLVEVVKTQSVHESQSVRGTLIGFRSPAFSKGISVAGYHWHFLAADRRHGGHVLKLTLVDAKVKVCTLSQFEVKLPRNEEFAEADQSKDRSEEIKLVEGW